jgi:hypothetical protein
MKHIVLMLSFNCALEGPSIPFDDEDGEYQSHFGHEADPEFISLCRDTSFYIAPIA